MQFSNRTLPFAYVLRRAHQLFPVRGWGRIFRGAFDPAHQRSYRFEIPLFEATFVGNAENFIDWYAFFYGAYERDDLLVMRSLLSKISHAVVLDIGANVGHHSLALAPLAAVVHAFEPYPPRLACLRANAARNAHLPIVIHPVALGDADKDAPFRLPVTGEWAGIQFDPAGPLDRKSVV